MWGWCVARLHTTSAYREACGDAEKECDITEVVTQGGGCLYGMRFKKAVEVEEQLSPRTLS